MPDTRSEVQIIFSGKAQNLEDALRQVQSDLAGFGAQAEKAGAQAGEHLAAGERRAAHEASGLGERTRVAAEMVGLLGAESSEQVLKIEGLSSAFRSAQRAFGGFGGAIAATAGSFALFKGLDFLHESVDEAMQGEAAWARLSAAYAGNAQALAQVRTQIEDAGESWAALGLAQAQVADLAARARGRGLDVSAILGDPQALADTAAALGPGTGIAGALDAIASPRGGRQVLTHLGLSVEQLRQATQQMQFMTAAQRAAFVEQQVEASHFKGVGTAFEQTDAGKLLKFHTMMQNLQEEVGTALLPAILQLVEAMTGLLQGAEKVAQPFGGLANVLKTLFVPMVGLSVLLFTNLRGVMTRLVDLLLGRLVGAFAQGAGGAAEMANAVRSIPERVDTVAGFDAAAASLLKDRYLANLLLIPGALIGTTASTSSLVSTAAFEDAVATSEVTTYAGRLAALRTPILTTAAFSAVAIPAAVITTLALQSGALRPVTDAIGHLVGHIVRWTWHAPRTVDVTAHVHPDKKTITVDATVDQISVKAGQKVQLGQTAEFRTITVPPGAHVTIATPVTLPHIVIPKGTTVSVHGTAIVDGVQLPAGKTLTIHGTGQLDNVVLKKGATVDVSGGSATIDTLHVKTITANLSPLAAALTIGTPQNPYPFHIKYVVAGGTPKTDGSLRVTVPPVKLDTGSLMGMMASTLVGTLVGTVLGSLVTRLPFGQIGGWLKGLVGKGDKGDKGGKGGGGIGDLIDKGLLRDMTADQRAGMGGILQQVKDLVNVLPEGAPTAPPVPVPAVPTSTFMVSGITDAFKSINWSAVLSAAGFAAKIAGAIAVALGAALLAVLSGLGKVLSAFFGPTAARAETTAEAERLGLDKKKTAALQESMSGAVGDIASAILGGLGDAIKRGMIGLENLFLGLFNAIIDKVKSAPVVGGLFKGVKDIPLIPIPAPPAAAASSARPQARADAAAGGAGGAPVRREAGGERRADAPTGGAVVNTFAGLSVTPRGTRTSLTIPGYGQDIERGNVYGVGARQAVRLPAGGIYDPTHSTKYEAAIDLPGGKVLDIMHILNTLGTKARTLTAGTQVGTALDFTNLKGYQASTLAGPRLTKEYISEAGAVEVGLYDSALHAWARNAGGDLDIGAFLAAGQGRTTGTRSGGGRSGFGGAVPAPAPAVHPALAPRASRLAPAVPAGTPHPAAAALPPAFQAAAARLGDIINAAGRAAHSLASGLSLLASRSPVHPAMHAAAHPALGPIAPRAVAPPLTHGPVFGTAHPAVHSTVPAHPVLHVSPALNPAGHAAPVQPTRHAPTPGQAIQHVAHAATHALPAPRHAALSPAVHVAAHVALAAPSALHRAVAQPVPAPAAHPAHAAAALAARLAPAHPAPALAAHHAAPAHPAAAAHQVSHNTYNATFNIHGATDGNAVARQVNRAFSEFVQGARAQRRLHG